MHAETVRATLSERLSVTVHPRSSRQRIEHRDDGLHVWLTAAPVGGRANQELLNLLAEYFGKPRSAIRLASGQASRRKVVELG